MICNVFDFRCAGRISYRDELFGGELPVDTHMKSSSGVLSTNSSSTGRLPSTTPPNVKIVATMPSSFKLSVTTLTRSHSQKTALGRVIPNMCVTSSARSSFRSESFRRWLMTLTSIEGRIQPVHRAPQRECGEHDRRHVLIVSSNEPKHVSRSVAQFVQIVCCSDRL